MSKKETAKRIPGYYTEDDGKVILIGPNGKEIKNQFVDMGLNPDVLGYNTVIKPTLKLLKKTGGALFKDIKTATIDTPLAVGKALYQEAGVAVGEWNQINQQKRAKDQIVWSERHGKYMSQYDLRIEDIKDASKINE